MRTLMIGLLSILGHLTNTRCAFTNSDVSACDVKQTELVEAGNVSVCLNEIFKRFKVELYMGTAYTPSTDTDPATLAGQLLLPPKTVNVLAKNPSLCTQHNILYYRFDFKNLPTAQEYNPDNFYVLMFESNLVNFYQPDACDANNVLAFNVFVNKASDKAQITADIFAEGYGIVFQANALGPNVQSAYEAITSLIYTYAAISASYVEDTTTPNLWSIDTSVNAFELLSTASFSVYPTATAVAMFTPYKNCLLNDVIFTNLCGLECLISKSINKNSVPEQTFDAIGKHILRKKFLRCIKKRCSSPCKKRACVYTVDRYVSSFVSCLKVVCDDSVVPVETPQCVAKIGNKCDAAMSYITCMSSKTCVPAFNFTIELLFNALFSYATSYNEGRCAIGEAFGLTSSEAQYLSDDLACLEQPACDLIFVCDEEEEEKRKKEKCKKKKEEQKKKKKDDDDSEGFVSKNKIAISITVAVVVVVSVSAYMLI
ncbi:hypothetical protein ENBRE01_0125 [Enteropsectra breve]|nr:hypothetical protein ENBRE01_0125 [Enteropsectra breve]